MASAEKAAPNKVGKDELVEIAQLLSLAIIETNRDEFDELWNPLSEDEKNFIKRLSVPYEEGENGKIKLGPLANRFMLETYRDFNAGYPEGVEMPNDMKDQMTQRAEIFGAFTELLR